MTKDDSDPNQTKPEAKKNGFASTDKVVIERAPSSQASGSSVSKEGESGTPASKESGEKKAAPTSGPANESPTINVVAQYIKDLSFENPHAPESFRPKDKPPEINININVNANPVTNNEFDVELKIEATAHREKDVMFRVELTYGGIFRLLNVPKESIAPAILIECPRMLFPFARQIVADATRNGGFHPLLIDPIDFVALYRKRVEEEKAAGSKSVSVTVDDSPKT